MNRGFYHCSTENIVIAQQRVELATAHRLRHVFDCTVKSGAGSSLEVGAFFQVKPE